MPVYLGAVRLWAFSFSVLFLSISCLFLAIEVFKRGRAHRISTPLDPWIGVYLVLFIFSASQSLISTHSLIEAWKLLAVIAAFYITVCYCRERKNVKSLGTVIIVLGGALSLMGLLQYVGALPRDWWHIRQFLSATYVNHNHFAGLLELLFPVSLGFALAERDRAKKTFFIYACCLMGLAFLLALSRGGYISMALGLFFTLILMVKRSFLNKGWPVLVITGLLLTAASSLFGWDLIAERLGTLRTAFSEDASLADRFFIWQGALSVIAKYPWLGTGPGTFGHAFLPMRPAGYTARPEFAHNDYLHLISDCGWPAFIVVAVLFIVLLVSGYRIIHQDDSRLRIGVGAGCLGALVSIAVHSLIDFNFHIPANWLWVSVIAGLLVSLDEKRKTITRAIGIFAGIMLLFLTAALAAGSIFYGPSDYFLWKATRPMPPGQKEKALVYLDKSISWNSTNDRAYFLRGLKHRTEEEDKAAEDFMKASKLNPFEPYYDYHLTRSLLAIKRISAQVAAARLGQAIAKDPHDPKLLYLSAKTLLEDKSADASAESAALRWLDKAVELDPRQVGSVYRVLYKRYRSRMPKNELPVSAFPGTESLAFLLQQKDPWATHRKYFLERHGIDPESKYEVLKQTSWAKDTLDCFKLSDFQRNKSTAKYGEDLIYCNDILSRKFFLKRKPTKILIRARGTLAQGSYPYLIVKADGRVTDSIYVKSRTWANFYTVVELGPGEHLLAIEFVNDLYDEKTREDRNVWIDRIEIQYPSK